MLWATVIIFKKTQRVNLAEEISQLALIKSGKMEDILKSTMTNKKNVKDNLVDLITKMGEKITLRRSAFIGKDKSINFSYTHSSLKKNVGKLVVLLSIETTKQKSEILDLGKQLTMQVAASSPLAIDKESLCFINKPDTTD